MRSINKAILIAASIFIAASASAQSAAAPVWEDVATWGNVHPTETDNIVYATVPHIPNPSAAAAYKYFSSCPKTLVQRWRPSIPDRTMALHENRCGT